MKKFRAKTVDFLEKELKEGEEVELYWGNRNGEYAARGIVTNKEHSPLIGKHNAYEIDLGDGQKIHVKMQILGDIPATKKNDTVALTALSGAEIYGRNDTLMGETGPLLVRISVQRHIPKAKDPKQFIRAVALARNVPNILKTPHTVSDTGPENAGVHAYDIYITSLRRADIDKQIIKMKNIPQFIEEFGAPGLRALAEIHELLGNPKYQKQMLNVAEKYERDEQITASERELVLKAFMSALRDYPKTEEFWRETHSDIIAEIQELKRLGIRSKALQNLEKYAARTLLRQNVSWQEKVWHTAIIKKNLTKLWLHAMKKRGKIRVLSEESPQQRAGPSPRP